MDWNPPRNIIEAAEAKRARLHGTTKTLAELAREVLEAETEKARELVRKPLPSPAPEPPTHGAEDGGSGTLELEHFTFYGVQAWAGMFTPTGGGRLRIAGEARAADVGIVLPSGSEEVRVRFYRETLEAWAARSVLEQAPGAVLLWDGGLTPLIAGRKPWSERRATMRELAERAASELGAQEDGLPGLVGEYHARRPLGVQDLLEDYGLIRPGTDHLWVSYLEYLEKLEAVRLLLQTAFRQGGAVVFVTKTSRSKSLLDGVMPDVYYLARAEPQEPFYTAPRLRCSALDTRSLGGRGAERLVPEEYRGFYAGEVAVIDIYARLQPGASILRLEMALPSREACARGEKWLEEEAQRLISRLLGSPHRRGYPYALLVAHREAHLPRDQLVRAARILGLSGERSGRSMLE